MATAVELRARRATTWERGKEILEQAEAADRDLTAEERQNWDQVERDLAALDERIKNQELLERTRSDNAPPPAETRDQATLNDEQRREAENEAFRAWLRGGMSALTAEQRQHMVPDPERRALSVGSDTGVGFLVPSDFRRQIESRMLWYGGMREAVTVISTENGQDLQIPTDDDTGNVGELVGENTAVSEQDTTVGLKVLRAHTYSSKMIRVPYTLLQDSAFAIEPWLADKLAERVGRIQNTHFTTGTGADRPTGITVDAVSALTAASATTVTWDELIRLEHAVDRAYRPRGRYMLADSSVSILRRLKDGEGRYLWQPGTTAGAPNTINNFPYTVNSDMPAMATGNKAVLFGDLGKYVIRDVRGFSLLTLRERYAEFLQIALLGFARADGKLIDAGGSPVQCITMA